ncbi:MAG: protein arginine kinase [Clostridia bacterium]|nr:protein arginine kinase [Clostridia bacterium]
MSWYDKTGPLDDIVISTRVRLARNLKGIPFPAKMSKEQFFEVNKSVKEVIEKSPLPIAKELKFINMDDIPDNERESMVERHIISPAFSKNYSGRAILINKDETICVMIGEEDHIRIQIILPGLQLENAYNIASLVDDMLCSNLEIAYDKRLGFLTECPTNVGTGLRASVMMHLPLTAQNGNLRSFINQASKIGYTVRGIYGEGSKAYANFYQISNQITLGVSEENVLKNLNAIAENLLKNENELINRIDKTRLLDISSRALGTLKYAKIISSNEMMTNISNLMIGVAGKLITVNKKPYSLFIEGQPYNLMKKYGQMSAEERDVKRAEILNEL